MKKYFISLGLIAAAAFTLTNCTQEIIDPNQEPETVGVPFEIVASPAVTKTVNDGMSTVWAEGDAINLFHQFASEGAEYVSDGEFKFDGENIFKGQLAEDLEEASVYNWYAIYPYSSYYTTPTGEKNYMPVGSKKGAAQTQDGNNSLAHIAGANYPLAGVCLECEYAASEPVQIEMSHLTSLLEVVVKNQTGDNLVVESVSFTGTEPIIGTFYINIASGTPVFTPSDPAYVDNTANLTVKNADPIANGESANFYLAIKPFKAPAGSTLTLYVNGAAKEVTLNEDVQFEAGTIKTLSYTLNEEIAEPEALSVEAFLAKAESSAVWYQLTGTIRNIVNTTYGNFDLVDETGSVYVYGLTKTQVASNDKSFASLGLKEGDVVTLKGTRASYNSAAQVGGPAYYVSHIPATDAPLITCEDNVVTITADANATIYYTIDGEEPTMSSLVYNQPFEIEETITVKAIAIVEGKVASIVTTKSCNFVQEGEDVEPQVVFSETFTGTNGTMGWTGSVANGNSIKYDNAGWVVANAYGAANAIKLGASGKKGSATTPPIAITGNAILKFRAGAWNGDQTTLILNMTNGTLGQSSVTMKNGDWTEYEISLTGVSSGATITFEGKQASKARFFLDDVQIIQ